MDISKNDLVTSNISRPKSDYQLSIVAFTFFTAYRLCHCCKFDDTFYCMSSTAASS